jgi:repressor LexA
MARDLTQKQREILLFVENYIAEHNYPPTVRDIREGCKLSSTSVVDYNLKRLEALEYVSRDTNISRSIKVLRSIRGVVDGRQMRVRMIGTIAAGLPIPGADDPGYERDGEYIELARDLIQPPRDRELFALQVRGNSMIEDLISDGDVVIFCHQETAQNGDMVAAWIDRGYGDGETTLKRFYQTGEQVRLKPANPLLQDMFFPATQVRIMGKVLMVIRNCNGGQAVRAG